MGKKALKGKDLNSKTEKIKILRRLHESLMKFVTWRERHIKEKNFVLLLAFFVGSIGIHDFYLGYTKNGIIKIVLTCCTAVGGSIWALVDLIRLLTGSLHTDANGVELKKEF